MSSEHDGWRCIQTRMDDQEPFRFTRQSSTLGVRPLVSEEGGGWPPAGRPHPHSRRLPYNTKYGTESILILSTLNALEVHELLNLPILQCQ